MNCYKYPRPAVTVDAVVFRKKTNNYEVLLIERKFPPYQGKWALPGGFVDMHEPLYDAVCRELQEETGLTDVTLQQLQTFGNLNRDPRGRTISVVYWGVVEENRVARAGDDAAKTKWFPVSNLPDMAFDHQNVMEKAILKINNIQR